MQVPVAQIDPVFEGVDGGAGSLVKFNPLSNVTSQEVWNFLRVMVRFSAFRLQLCMGSKMHTLAVLL